MAAPRMMVESFKRLYKDGRMTKEQVAERVESGLLTKANYKEITGEKYDG